MSWRHEGRIITHDQAMAYYDQNIMNIEQPYRDIGYHAGIELIENDYEILIGRMFNETGAHCRDKGMNNKSIGICFVGNFDLKEPSEEQWKKGLKFVKGLLEFGNLDRKIVKGHREFTDRKSCPGKLFDLDEFRRML